MTWRHSSMTPSVWFPRIAAYEKFHDHTSAELTLDEIERIVVWQHYFLLIL